MRDKIKASKVIRLDERSKYLRGLVLRAFQASRRGHLASAFSLVEILQVLYDDILRFKPSNPDWQRRDRLILSKGHGCLALYAILSDKGFFPKKELDRFCQFGALLGGHPEDNIPGVEFSTGSEGHGLSVALGMALNGLYEKSDHQVFVILGDGETNEGSVWEAALSIGKHKPRNLTVIIDYNKMQSYSTTYEVQDLEPIADKWKAFGFRVYEVNGHDKAALKKIFRKTKILSGPRLIICHTVKGKGIKFIENQTIWHHKRGMTDDDIQSLLKALEDYP